MLPSIDKHQQLTAHLSTNPTQSKLRPQHKTKVWTQKHELVSISSPQILQSTKSKKMFKLRFLYKDQQGKKRSHVIYFGQNSDFIFTGDKQARMKKIMKMKNIDNPFHSDYWSAHLANKPLEVYGVFHYCQQCQNAEKSCKSDAKVIEMIIYKHMYPKYVFQDIQKQEETAQQQRLSILKIRAPKPFTQGIVLTPGTQHILLPSFACLILGKPSSGKSHIISQFLDQPAFYNKKFDRIIYIGPTRYDKVIHDEYNTTSNFDMKFIDKKINQCRQWAANMLIVMDDVISQMPSTQKSRAQELFFNRRHELKRGTISIIVTSQKLTSVPTWIRSSINSLIVFSIPKCEIKALFNEIPLIVNAAQIKAAFENLLRHQFVYFNLELGKAFDSNFQEI